METASQLHRLRRHRWRWLDIVLVACATLVTPCSSLEEKLKERSSLPPSSGRRLGPSMRPSPTRWRTVSSRHKSS